MSMTRSKEDLDFKTYVGGESRTKQSFVKECDINRIMARHAVTGLVNHVAKTMPEYGDFTNAIDYQEACNMTIRADEAFASLPSHVRERMNNDPGTFIDFMSDPKNQEEAEKLGIVSPSKPIPPKAEQSDTPPPAGGEGRPAAEPGE